MRIAIIVIGLLLNACASKQIADCPQPYEEQVSVCRAHARCGLGGTKSIILGALGAYPAMQQCVERDLDAQRSNAGIASNRTTCKSVLYTDNTVRTVCE